MHILLIECLLFLLGVSGIEESGTLEKWDYSSLNEKTMKTILESCYKKDSLANPIIIFGDFNQLIDKRSIIRINSFLKVDEAQEKRQLLSAGASKVILIANSPRELISHLLLLRKTRWWNPKVPHFIIDKSNRPCKNIEDNLSVTWHFDLVNSIYICAESINESLLSTMNGMAKYAPYPWKLRGLTQSEKYPMLYIFHRVFSTNISCKNLNYDKTKLLYNYEITMVEWVMLRHPVEPGSNQIQAFNALKAQHKILPSIIKALKARPRFEVENSKRLVMRRILRGTADITAAARAPHWFPNITLGQHFPHNYETMIAVVRLKPEVSTLEKIGKLWSIQVLIAAAIAIVILMIVLTIIHRDFSAAMLDMVRFLISTSIVTNNRTHPFRIYFTTMLIFILISNGVFQGRIAAFLTTQERGIAIESMNKLGQKGYKMYTRRGLNLYIQRRFPKYNVNIVAQDVCIQLVLNNTNHVCFIHQSFYEANYILHPLDCVKERWSTLLHFVSRRYWPIEIRFNDMIMRHVESGIVNFWKTNLTSQPIRKRRAMEAEWSSPQYKPVRLYKLKFAFQLLALGLSLSTFVFFVELLVAKCSAR